MKQKAIIDSFGYIKTTVMVDNEDNICWCDNLKLEPEEKLIDLNYTDIFRPRWNGVEWIEDASEEEIQASKEENITKEKEPTSQELLNAQLLEEIAQQKIVNAQLMQEIALLKGGSTNV